MNVKSIVCKSIIVINNVQDKILDKMNKHINSELISAMQFAISTTNPLIKEVGEGKLSVEQYFKDGQHVINGVHIQQALEGDMYNMGTALKRAAKAINEMGDELCEPKAERLKNMPVMVDINDLDF